MAPLYFSLTLAFDVCSLHWRAVTPTFSWQIHNSLYIYSKLLPPPPTLPGNMMVFNIFFLSLHFRINEYVLSLLE